VTAASQDISKKFGEENLVGTFLMSLQIFAILVKYINSLYLIKMSHYSRTWIVTIMFVIGYLLMTLSYTFKDNDINGFYLALIATSIIGSACYLGESVTIGKSV